MLKLKLMKSEEEFIALKKGDKILVKWSENWVDHMPKSEKIMFYKIHQNKTSCDEIICQWKDNHYFNYKLYLQDKSAALEVYSIVDEEC